MRLWLGILTGIVALMLSVLLAAYFNGVPYSHNAATLLISVLGVIVTALVGWQVFNAIENVKTLKKMDGLETELRSKSEQIVTLNSQVLDLIEAHHERSMAQGIKYWERKYEHACKSLKLFLRGNIKSDYEPLQSLLRDMSSIIERVNKEATEDEKIVFARAFTQFDNEHNDIIDIIHSREDNLKSMRRRLISLRDKRKKLFDDYANKETSEEKKATRRTSEAQGNSENPNNPDGD